MATKILFLSLLLIGIISKSYAENTYSIQLDGKIIHLQDSIHFLAKNSIEDSENPLAALGIDTQTEHLLMRILLENITSESYEWVIDFNRNDHVSIKVFSNGLLIEKDTAGYLVPASLRKYRKWNASKYTIPPGEKRLFEIHIISTAHGVDPNLSIYTKDLWMQHVYQKLLGDIVFLVIVFIFSIYNVLIYFQTRIRAYIYFGLYLFVIFFFFALGSLLLRDYVFYEYPQISLYFIGSLLTAVFFYWRFLQSLINTREQIKPLDKMMEVVIWLSFTVIVIQLVLFGAGVHYRVISAFTQVTISITIVAVLIALISLFSSRDRFAKYFLYGSFIMLLGAAHDAYFWDSKPVWGNLSRVGVILEILFFSMGLGKKIQIDTKKNKDDLEKKVRQRTFEINRQRDFFATILNEVSSSVFVRDEKGDFVFCNEPYALLFNIQSDKIIGNNINALYAEDPFHLTHVRGQDLEVLNSTEGCTISAEERGPSGSNLWMKVSKSKIVLEGKPYVLGVLFDISSLKLAEENLRKTNTKLQSTIEDLKNTESKLVEAEKMASIGHLTAGLAHEIGNPVNYLAGNVQPLLLDLAELEALIEKLEENRSDIANTEGGTKLLSFFDQVDFHYTIKEIKQLMEGIDDGSSRVKTLVESLRDFSRTDTDKMLTCDINQSMKSTIRLIEHSVKGKIEIIVDLDPNLPHIECVMGQIGQVFLNLIDNAIQSIDGRGTIKIVSSQKNDRVIFSIEDSGAGIPEEVKAKIFEPFFTTKEVGKGTGLGLAMCQRIIQKHQGTILFESEEGKGTIFLVTLPVRQKTILI